VAEHAQGDPARPLPPCLLQHAPQQRPAGPGAARLLGHDEAQDLADVGVARERGREAQPDVADDVCVQFGDEVVPGAEPFGVEGRVRRLGARLDGVQRGPCQSMRASVSSSSRVA
jgi:hypothetical protein